LSIDTEEVQVHKAGCNSTLKKFMYVNFLNITEMQRTMRQQTRR
jgi:hypothetical protein